MKDIKKIIENQVVVNSDGVLCIESFLNQMLDVELLHDIAKEWNSRFKDANITKILTIESGGIALATALGLLINVPVVYAKKEYSTKLPEGSVSTKIYSCSLKKSYYAYVSEDFINDEDNVLIVDDVVANGWAADGLCDLCVQQGATIEGICTVLEKNYLQGAKRLRSKGIRVESLVKLEKLDSANKKVIFADEQ